MGHDREIEPGGTRFVVRVERDGARHWLCLLRGASSSGLFAALLMTTLCACNTLLGLDDTAKLAKPEKHVEVPDSGSGCVLTSDCPERPQKQICIFRVCSAPCAKDRDCAEGERCLTSDEGPACVATARAACSAKDDCPSGSECLSGECRNGCSDTVPCLEDQSCEDGACKHQAAPSPAETTQAQPSNSTPKPSGPDAGEPKPTCSPNEHQCTTDENGEPALVTCGAEGDWSEPQACPFVCSANECRGECTPQSRQCQGDKAYVCSDAGLWTLDEACAATCERGACVSQCTEGLRDCSDDTPRKCTQGEWASEQPCPFACSNGTCSGECAPNDHQCVDGRYQTCAEDGKWNAGDECPFLCVGGRCGGECTPRATRCLDTHTQQTCNADGQWSSDLQCDFVCDDQLGVCGGECKPGSSQCADDAHEQVCDDQGSWGPLRECTLGCTGKTCAEGCETDDKRCVNDDTELATCVGGSWQNETCEFVCVDQQCAGECEPGTTQCLNGKTQQTCSTSGTWGNNLTCQFLCAHDACAGECVPNDTQCSDDDTEQDCDAEGTWSIVKDCDAVCTGDACSGECAPDDTQCLPDGETRQTCNRDGQWAGDFTCPYLCAGKECAGSCKPTTTQCLVDGKTRQTCSADGAWGDDFSCPYLCTGDDCAGECVPGSGVCANATQIKLCDQTGNLSSSPTTCTVELGGLACHDDECTGECSPGDVRCYLGDAEQCLPDGTWMQSDNCSPPDEICRTGQCVANTPYYVGNSSVTGWSNFDPPNGKVFMIRVLAPETANVLSANVQTRTAGGSVKMAFYTDASGVPGTLIGQTSNFSTIAGISSTSIASGNQITKGTYYWIAAKFFGSPNATTYSQSVQGSTVYSIDTMFSATFPNTWGVLEENSGVTLPFFIGVQDVSM